MRNFLPNTAMEAHLDGSVAVQVLSLEEELLEGAELQAAGTEIESDLAEANKVIEVSDCMEDIASIAETIPEATAQDLQLIEAAGQMAVAGSPVDASEVIPAMEAAFIGKRIAVEDIRETARKIWEKIRAFVKNLWVKIEAFFYKYLGTVPRYRKAVDELEAKVDAISGQSVKDGAKVTISSGATQLSVDGKVQTGGADLKKAVGNVVSASEQTFGGLQDAVVAAGTAVVGALEKFDPKTAEDDAKALVGKLESSYHTKPTGAGSDNKRYPGYQTLQGTSLLGNKSLIVKICDKSVLEHGTLAALDKMRNSGYNLVATSDKEFKAPASTEFAPLSPADCKALLEDARKLLTLVEDYKRGTKAKKVRDIEKQLDAASSKATEAMNKAMTAEAGARGTVPYYRALVNFNEAYTRWAYYPAGPMMKLALETVSAIRMVVGKSVACYAAPKAE